MSVKERRRVVLLNILVENINKPMNVEREKDRWCSLTYTKYNNE